MSTKTKPCIAFYCSSVSWGGLEMNTVRYAQWMSEAGFPVILFCVAQSPIHQKASSASLRIITIRRNRKYFDFINAWRVSRLFRLLHIEWVWFRDTRDMSLLALVKRIQPGLRLLYQQAMQLGVDKKDLFHTLRFKAIDVWVSTLQFLKDQVVMRTHFPAEKIQVVPLGVDASALRHTSWTKASARQHLRLSGEKFIAGIIGRIDPLKGQHTLINALQILNDTDIHVMIIGESTKNESRQYEKDLKHKVRSLGLESSVSFFPYSDDVSVFYRAMDVFVMASKGETFGTVTIEAMSMGIPVIGTGSSGTPEILENGSAGLLFEPDNAQELAEAIFRLKNSPELCSALREQALRRFETHYSKTSSVAGMSALIHP